MNAKPNDLQEVIPGKHYSFWADLNFQKFNLWLFLAALTTVAGDVWFYHHPDSSFTLRIIIALIPLPTILLWFRSLSRWIRGMDEFQHRITLKISLFAATRTILVILIWLRLGQIGTLKTIFEPFGKVALRFENTALTQYCSLAVLLYFFFFWLGNLIISRRYK